MPDKGAMHPMVKCSTPSRMIEEDSVEETEVYSTEGDGVSRPENTTPTNGKTMGTILGTSAEEGAILLD